MLEKRGYLAAELDHFRRFLMLEPRGHADMYGAILTPPATADGDVGVLFMHNEGYSTMCGHGIIALVTAGVEHGLFNIANSDDIRIDSPAGRISARANANAAGEVESVTFRNVPSFILLDKIEVMVRDRAIRCTIAFGGAFYAYVDAGPLGFELTRNEAPELIRLGQEIKEAVSARYEIRHPDSESDLDYLYGTIFFHAGESPRQSRNACIFAQAQLDRSPTGTGVSGRAAIDYASGELQLGETLEIASIIDTRFQVKCVAETTVGGKPAVIPEVTGSAWMTGRSRFVMNHRDPLRAGFLLR
jgi:trans-L-3-hydroxyproline dehydratase